MNRALLPVLKNIEGKFHCFCNTSIPHGHQHYLPTRLFEQFFYLLFVFYFRSFRSSVMHFLLRIAKSIEQNILKRKFQQFQVEIETFHLLNECLLAVR